MGNGLNHYSDPKLPELILPPIYRGFDTPVEGIVSPGHGHASGCRSTKYPEGTINLQKPAFLEKGVDITHCFSGTINLNIAPHAFTFLEPEIILTDVAWKVGRRPENFYLARAIVLHEIHGEISGLLTILIRQQRQAAPTTQTPFRSLRRKLRD